MFGQSNVDMLISLHQKENRMSNIAAFRPIYDINCIYYPRLLFGHVLLAFKKRKQNLSILDTFDEW